MCQPDQASVDGYDITIQTNVLSHFLLTGELMPLLEQAACRQGEARVVSMSSGSGFGPPALNRKFFERRGGDLGGKQASYERYHQSKLANLLFTSSLSDKLGAKGSRVKALACTPGVCATDMYAHVQSFFNPSEPVNMQRVQSVEDGCLGQLKCICDSSVSSGEVYGPQGLSGMPVAIPLKPPMILVDDHAEADLWEDCERAVGRFEL